MAGVAVGQRVHQHRAALGLEYLELAPHGFNDGQWAVAVDALGVHLLGIHPGADACQEVIAHRLTARLAAHGVLVIHDVEQERQTTLHIAFPEGVVLIHRR